MLDVMESRTVGEYVTARPSRSRVFERFGIDYCCGGKKPLAQACQERNVPLDQVLAALAESDAASDGPEIDWSTRPMSELCDHIIERHHDYLRRELPRLDFMLRKVLRAHGQRHPWVEEALRVFTAFRDELTSHMHKEEEILFPMIRKLEAAETMPAFHCGSISAPISVMEMEHDDAGSALEHLRELSNQYTPPEGACNTFRAVLAGLQELETDMHAHVHKENSILFPAAARREAQLLAR